MKSAFHDKDLESGSEAAYENLRLAKTIRELEEKGEDTARVRLSDVKALLGECDEILRRIEVDEARGPRREYLVTARANTMRAFRAVSKAMECEE